VKFIIDNWMLITVALTSGAMLMWPIVAGAAAAGVSATAAVQLMNREKAVVIDVSEPHEFAAGHVTGSKNLPLADLEKRLPETVKNKNLPVILVCATGLRAKKGLSTAKALGYEQAQVLSGGLGAWRTATLPLEKA
jgi:rhodanese-related sulfurtransferase